MTTYLNPDQVAERLGVSRRKAMALMLEMNPIPVCGNVRRRYRIKEESLDAWMTRRMAGRPKTGGSNMGSSKKLARR